MTRLGRDLSVGQQEKLARAAKLRQEADELERQAGAEASRPGPRNREIGDGDFIATVYTPPKASDIFKDDGPDKVGDIIRDFDPVSEGKRRRRR
jgi:hypothetical protein